MSDNHVEGYDFRRTHQLADDVEQMVMSWQRNAAKLMTRKLYDNFDIHYEFSLKKLKSVSVTEFEEAISDPTLITEHTLGSDHVGWLTIPRRFMIGLLELMFTKQLEEVPEDRALTDIEKQIYAQVVVEMCTAMTESQTTAKPLACDIVAQRKLDEVTQSISDREQLVVTEMRLMEPFEEEVLRWTFSQAAVLRFVSHISDDRNAQPCESPELERLIHQIPIEVSVRLGETQVRWDQLSTLAEGDIIMLNQRVSQPLKAQIGNQPVFLGFAGKHGNRQAFHITGIVAPES